MQYGKPVVGCLTGGIPEVVEQGVEGLLVPPDQPEALGAALARLMQDDELRLRMGNAARARIHERDNYQTMAARLEEVYRRVIVKKGAQYKARRKALWG
ncbi:MAG: glycosyltransferase family 4 protein [Anaerolineales bacterium]|nr:glycosyltransferase family 4 protein [Anaerolineales bacterium]